MVFAVSVALFFVSGLLLTPFFLIRSIRAVADHYAEKAIVGGVEMAAKQAERVSVVRFGREIIEKRLQFLPGWLRTLASAKVVGMIVEKVWKTLTGNLRIPLLIASWLYLLIVGGVLAVSIAPLSLALEVSATLLAFVLCGSIVFEFLVSRMVVARLCREPTTAPATQTVT